MTATRTEARWPNADPLGCTKCNGRGYLSHMSVEVMSVWPCECICFDDDETPIFDALTELATNPVPTRRAYLLDVLGGVR